MDRQLIYPGQIPLETDLLSTNKNAMVAFGLLAQDVLGSATTATGLACTQTASPSLAVLVAPGRLYSVQNIDSSAYSSLVADTTHQILKQAILLDAATLACPAPATAGFSVCYLIEAAYQDVDAVSVTLPYYNASNPTQAYSGPANSGTSQATIRKGVISLQAKVGIAATTGTQTVPAVDSGYVALWVVTVANGQTTITAPNIVLAANAPFLSTSLQALATFLQAGTGAVGRTPQDKARDIVSVKDFGAKGDGVADDTVAIQRAINFNPNGTVFFPAGAYNITSTLTVNYDVGTGKNNTNLVGTGLGSTLLWNGGNNTSMFWYQATSINAGTFSKTLITGLYLKNAVAATGLLGLRFGNFGGSLAKGGGVGNVTVKGNKFDSFAICIQTEYESDGFEISDNVFATYTQYGFYNNGSARVHVSGNYFQFGTAGSLAIFCQYTTITISDNLIQSSATGVVGAIKLLNCNGWRIEANYMEFAQTGAQFAILVTNSRDGYIGSNPIQGFQGADCIYIDATSGNINIGPNSYGFFTAAPNSLIRMIAGASNVNILGTQSFTGGAAPATPFIGAGYNVAIDNGTFALGLPAYTSTPNAGVTMAGTGVVNIGNSAAAAGWAFMSFCRSGANIGSISQSGTTGIIVNTTSDQHLKEDLGVCESTDVIARTRVHDFTWKSDGSADRGVFAQEAFEVKPSAVHVGTDERNEDGNKVNPWGVDYSRYVPDLIVDAQALRALIGQLQADVAALKTSGGGH